MNVRRALTTPLLPFVQWKDARVIRTRHVRIGEPTGIRLLLVSDIHARNDWFPRESVASLVDLINAQEAIDAVLHLGDYVGNDVTAVEWAAAEFARIAHPQFGVLGNHDHWTRPKVDPQILEDAGVMMLMNRSTQLTDDVWLAGIDSMWGGNPQPEQALAGIPAEARTVVLGHEPPLALRHEAFLHVAGHTHHGQVRSPLFGETIARRNYVKHSEPFPRGLYRRGEHSWVYTTAGVGYSTVSFRVCCPPEIVVLEI
jgi:uncharacterized protein